jgi:hypothetical protein
MSEPIELEITNTSGLHKVFRWTLVFVLLLANAFVPLWNPSSSERIVLLLFRLLKLVPRNT